MTCHFPNGSARARRCSGPANRMAGLPQGHGPVLPVISDPIYGYHRVNVEAQRRDPQSLLNWMERKIRMRKECPEISWGDWKIVPTDQPGVLVMRYEWNQRTLVTCTISRASPAPSCSTAKPLALRPAEGKLVDLLARPTTAARTRAGATSSSCSRTTTAGSASAASTRVLPERSSATSRSRPAHRIAELAEKVRAVGEFRDALETHLRHEPMKTSRSRIKRLRGLARPQYRPMSVKLGYSMMYRLGSLRFWRL